VRTGCDEFCDGVCESAGRVDVEYRIRILAIIHTTLREDDSDKVDARGVEEGKSRGVGKELDINVRNVANNILVVVEHGQRSDTLAVHK